MISFRLLTSKLKMTDPLDDIITAAKVINKTSPRYYYDKLAPGILIEENGTDIKLHMTKALYDQWVSNLYIKGTNSQEMSETIPKCNKCGVEFINLDELEAHNQAHHPEELQKK